MAEPEKDFSTSAGLGGLPVYRGPVQPPQISRAYGGGGNGFREMNRPGLPREPGCSVREGRTHPCARLQE